MERANPKDKVEKPQTHFDAPKEVVEDKALSHDEKKKALSTWEQDERQKMTASAEGMPAPAEGLNKKDDNCLDDVVKAKQSIGEKPKHKPAQ